MRTWRAPQDRDDGALLVTELVGNVADHVGGEESMTMELEMSDGWLRISVADGSSVRPVVRELNTGSLRGRGLRLVQGIADHWGAEDYQGGKRVSETWHHQSDPLAGLPPPAAGDAASDDVRRIEGDRE